MGEEENGELKWNIGKNLELHVTHLKNRRNKQWDGENVMRERGDMSATDTELTKTLTTDMGVMKIAANIMILMRANERRNSVRKIAGKSKMKKNDVSANGAAMKKYGANKTKKISMNSSDRI
jgi:hypothetical protein